MSSYLAEVLNASGGAAAPEEVLETLENPCWEGYVQIGMKEGKDGNPVPNCVPANTAQALEDISSVLSLDELEEVLSTYNSKVGSTRQVKLDEAAVAASRAKGLYVDNCDSAELSNAVLWEVHNFLEYATLGISDDSEAIAEYTDLLAEGHPRFALTASAASKFEWLSGDLNLEESSKDALRVVLSDSPNFIEYLHASTRVKTLMASGVIPAPTASVINSLLESYASH